MQDLDSLVETIATEKSIRKRRSFWTSSFLFLLVCALLLLAMIMAGLFLFNKESHELRTSVDQQYTTVLESSERYGVEIDNSSFQDGFEAVTKDYTNSLELLEEQTGSTLSEKVVTIQNELRSLREINVRLEKRIQELENLSPTQNAECKVIENGTECRVYFGTDAKDLSLVNEEFIDKVFRDEKIRNAKNISIVGHSDTMGSTELNLAISQRRANSVRDRVVIHYNGSSPETRGLGERNLPAPTSDEERSPQNRVVIIKIEHG